MIRTIAEIIIMKARRENDTENNTTDFFVKVYLYGDNSLSCSARCKSYDGLFGSMGSKT
jgi:hypothetical protein